MSSLPAPIRVRIAPSPTGHMHVGTARTALFNWLYARAAGGSFLLRIEDTDRKRYVAASLDDLLDGLEWLGLSPDEGPRIGGPAGPYFQSERLETYQFYADDLLASGNAYRCFCGPERLERVREARAAAGEKVGYDRACRSLTDEAAEARIAAGETPVLRLKMPLEGELTLHDVIRGDVTFDAAQFEDVVLMKSDGYPTYHLAVVIDDNLMAITHVLRADEWIPSAPVQIQLYRAFGWKEPVWAHMPLVLNPDGKGKLSKRKSGEMVQLRWYRDNGYLPEAMVNFLALLGWSYGGDEEVFTLAEAVERFRLEDIRPAGARWDFDKLNAMNGDYIRALDPDDLARRLVPFLEREGLHATPDEVGRMVPLVQERLTTLADAPEKLALFWQESVDPDPAEMIPKKLDGPETLDVLAAAEAALSAIDAAEWREATLEACVRDLAETLGVKLGPMLQPVRVAVTGTRVAPPMFGTLEIIGRDLTLERLAAGRARLAAYVATLDEGEAEATS